MWWTMNILKDNDVKEKPMRWTRVIIGQVSFYYVQNYINEFLNRIVRWIQKNHKASYIFSVMKIELHLEK